MVKGASLCDSVDNVPKDHVDINDNWGSLIEHIYIDTFNAILFAIV